MRQAQRKAVRGHLAARQAFLDGGSEAQVNAAYLAAAGHTDSDLPYNNIVGLNENGATLHYQYKGVERPSRVALAADRCRRGGGRLRLRHHPHLGNAR